MIKAKLLKPLDGQPEGSEAEFTNTDFETLERMGAVERVPDEAAPPEPPSAPPASEAPAPDVKESEAPENKMDAPVENKAAPKPATKRRG